MISLIFAGIVLAAIAIFALRGVKADTFSNLGGKFGITEQSRVGKLIKRIAPKAKLSPVEKAAPFATLTVTNGGDSGAGTLRNQIAAAASGDTIDFSGVTTVTLTSGELVINKNLTINGGTNGVTVTRGSGTFRIFTISSGTVSMSKLTITGGNPTTQAGGIQNSGNLTMTDCAITGNTSPQGGGIQNDGVLTMTNCTVSGNTSSGAGGGFAMFGMTTTLTNCTVSGNTASSSGGGFSISSGTLNLTNCTVANNTAIDGGAMNLSGSTHVFKNTIIANNTATGSLSENIGGTVSSTSSYNLIGVGGTGGLTNGTNNNQVDVASPGLDVLASNGGYTQTHALLVGSPALDKGAAVSGMLTDQRGQSRPYNISNIAAASGGNDSDIGAFEVNPTCNTVTVNPTSLPGGTVGVSYSQTFTATGGDTAYTYTVTSGSLPGGLALQSDGTLTGLPTAAGTFNFTVTATYGFGCPGSRAYSLVIAACANIKTYTVNDTGDAADSTPGNGVCATSGAVCTLRAAIQEINASPGCVNNVNFSVTGTINMSSAYPDLAAAFTFNGPGANQLTVRRNTSGTYRILTIPLGAGATISGLTFSNGLNDEGGAIRNAGALTVSDCAFSGNNSKGTNAGGPTGKTGGGGAIFNDSTGTATITRSALTGNIATGGNGETFTANGGGGGGGGLGGAIFNSGGTVTVTNTTLSGNSAIGGAGGAGQTTCPMGPGGKGGGKGADATTAAGFGGGGFGGGNNGSPSVGGRFGGGGGGRANFSQAGVNGGFLGGRGNNSSGCNSGGGGGGGAAGGAIFNYGGTFTIVNVTIANNSATGGALGSNGGSGSAGSSRAGGIYNETGTLTIKNSILAGNTAQQAGFEDSDFNSNAITTNGYNLFGSGTGNPTGGTQDQTIVPANVFTTAIGPLQYFGGTTQVHAPLTGSPVLDKGAAHSGITVDQRNKTRPINLPSISSAPGGDASDIGAFEMQACSGTVSITPTTLTPFGAGSPNTRTLTASGGTSPYTFSLASGTLPAGVTLTSAGVLSGTATVTGTYPFSVQVYDQNDCTTTQAYTLDVITCATVTAQPLSQAVCDGGPVTLSVTLSDATGFSYQWRKGGNNISGATSSTYTIASFTPADVASYDVVMTSASCQTTSNAASLTQLGLTTMTNAMPYWAGRLNGAQFEVGTVAASGTNTWPATEPPGNAFDGTFAKSLIRNTTNTGYVFTPGSCDSAGRIINQMRIYTANDTVARDPASYAIYGTTSVISGNGPFAAAQFTLISSGSLALPSGRNTSSLSDTNSQLVSFANSTAYKSYMLVFPTNSGDGASTQIGEVKFYPENFQPTLNTTTASVTQGQSSTGNSIGTATTGTAQAANTLTTAVSGDGTNFGSSATLNGVTISNIAVAANGNVTTSLTATCAATNASFFVRITNNQSQSVTATVNVNVAASTAPGFASVATPSHQEGSPVSNSQIATVSDAETVAGSLTVTVTSTNPSSGVTISNIVNTGGTITADIVAACGASDASFTLQVSDGCATATTTLNVTVTTNTAPTLTYGNASVNVGNSTTVNPATGPSDNVSVSTIVVQDVTPSPAPATITVNNSTGVVTVPNNVPGGTYTVTIRATDNCGSFTDAMFTLTVVAPTLGTYPATTMALNAQATVTPDAAPINTTSVTVKASSGFNGTLYANPTTGVVKIVNANPAGTHTVTVTAFGVGSSSTKTFTLTVQSGTACPTPPQFSSGTSFSGGVGYHTAVGDFNNDGKQDLAITNYNTPAVSIRLGDGAGGFTSGATVSTNIAPLWAAVGDFNGDGNRDLAVACNSTVSIRLGDGAGNFTGSTNVSTGTFCYSVALGDFNGDGRLDFVTANNAVDTSSVRFGDGAGGFTGSSNVSVGDGPFAVVAGDFDNDGDMDFATSNATAGTVSVRLNNGAGTFSGSTEITVGSSPDYMQLGDFNEDGNLDFVSSNRSAGTLSIRFGNGTGGFTGSTNTSVGASPAQVVVADLNNDGNQDLAVKRSNLFHYLLGDGLGTFGSPVSVSVPGATGGYGLTLGDFNQDGRQDLIADNLSTGTYYVQLGGCNTAPTITAGGPLARQAGSAGSSATIATVNDTETAAGSLTVTATTVPTGITVTGITNTSGTITATVAAACNATVGANTVVLTVTDGNGTTATANLTVNVTANTQPTLTYNNASVTVGSGTTVNPATGPTDNGSISTIVVQSVSPSTTPGTITVNNTSGIVTVPNNVPAGTYTVTIRATDNCGGAGGITDAVFTLTVGCVTSLTVNNTGDGADATPGNGICETATGNGICTLRAAIQEANALTVCSPFTINFSVNGTITLGSALPAIGHPNLIITGNGAANTVISGNNTVAGLSVTAAGRTLALSNLTITNANSTANGAALNISGNNDTLTLTNCVLSNNTTTTNGGGLYLAGTGTTATLTNTTVSGNTAAGGGGLYVSISTLTFNNGTISGNTCTTGSGGGVLLTNGATLNANDSPFSNNSSPVRGSGIASVNLSNVNVARCTFTGNTGSGVISSSLTTTITNSTISGNTGPGIDALGGTTTVTNSTFSANTGANVFASSSGTVLNLVNTLSAGNSSCVQSSGATINATNSLIQGGLSCVNGTNTNNLTSAPLLGTLGNYGGTTQTVPLLPGSPAINAGTSSGAPTSDQRGIARVGNVDIGAFESRGFTMAIAGGNNQSATAGSAFALPLSVTVTSSNSEPVNGGQVTFTPPGSGASAAIAGNPATISSDAATSGTVTANTTAGGPYTVAAGAAGVATGVNFSLTNTGTTVSAINRASTNPACANSSVSWTVTFAASVTGVTASNFSLTGGTGASITNVTGSGTTWTVTAGTGTAAATLGLNLTNATGISPTVTGLPFTGQTYTVSGLPTTANAGTDQTLCATSATLAANTATVGTGAWSIVSGAGGSITTPSSPTSGFTGVAGTTYTLRWTISNSPCTASTDDVVITLTANPTTANAGPDQTVCATSATLAANTATIGTGAWSIVSGTGGSITTPASPTSAFTGTAGTTYTLRWTISNSPCTASTDDVIITLRANPTTANAGPDQTLCATSATLAANTATIGTGAWSIVSGAGGTVTTPASPTSGFTGTAGTTYTLRWTISNSPCTASTDDVVITLRANPTTSNAGPDQTICATSATLAANTPTVGTGAWSIVTGASGTVTTPSSPTSNFTGVAGTTYTLRWTISNSPCTASTDDVVITLTANPTTANAGPDQPFCGTSAATLAANTPSVGAGAWTVVSGPSTLASQFSSTSSPTATFTPAGGTGTYTLRWTISNSPCAASTDDVVLTYNALPTITLGANPSVLPGATSANLPYSATGGSPNQYSIDYNAAANTAGFVDVTNAALTASPIVLVVPGAAASGTYNATLTVRNSTTGCVSSATAFTVTISNCPSLFTVNDLGDAVDATPGNGVCATAGGVCTLRAAIQEANALTACSPMTITITATGTIALGSILPSIARSNLTITGPGANQLTVSGNNAVQVLQINAATSNITLSGLTVANGRVTNSPGAGLVNFSNGTVTLNNLAFTGNRTITGGDGGAISHDATGTLNVNGSTFSGNVSPGAGGAIVVLDAGTLNLTNCTFYNNTALNGGGVYNHPGTTVTLLNCTLSGNTATGGMGGLGSGGGTVNLKNTIIAGNAALSNPDVQGAFTSQGNNLIGNTTGGTGFGGADLLNVGALLGALGNYGGTTQTLPLLPGSPAINAGTSTGTPSTDQRGIARVGNVDIGAFESRGFTLALSGGNNQSAVTNSAFANPLSLTISSANGEPVNGGRVTFTPPGSGAGCTLATNPATISGGAASSTATANAIIGGPYNVSANANGATAINFSLTNLNSAPAFTPAPAISRQQGTPAGAAVTIGTVADAQTSAGSLIVTQIAGGSATGITVIGITNTGGTITAVVTADCAATPGTVRFQVSDGATSGTGDLTVNVTTNDEPAVTYGNVPVNGGASTTNSPATATDNGSITGYAVQSQGTFTGTISVNSSGVVSIGNAAPIGSHTITIRATDNCGAFTDANFTLTVSNTAPSFTPAAAISRQQGSLAGAAVTVGTVSDANTPVGGLTVTQIAGGSATGINVTGIVNTNGTITAVVTASCTATPGTVRFQVSDGATSGTGDLTVNVTTNDAPSVTYGNVPVNGGASTTNSPATATDNGSITGYAVLSQGTFTGTISVNSSGTVGIGNAAPIGSHTITIRVTDDCGAFTDANFTLTVNNTAPTFTPAPAISRQQGSAAGAAVTIGLVAA